MSPRLPRIGTSKSRTPDAAPGAATDVLLQAQAQRPRGLRAGPQALDDARAAYQGAQWSGEHDRRPEPGLLVRARL